MALGPSMAFAVLVDEARATHVSAIGIGGRRQDDALALGAAALAELPGSDRNRLARTAARNRGIALARGGTRGDALDVPARLHQASDARFALARAFAG